MGCDNASFRRQRAERAAAPARRPQNPTPAPSLEPLGRRDVGTGAVPDPDGGARFDGPCGNGPPDATPLDEHPSDPDPWLCAKLDELHAAVRAADSQQRGSRTSDQEACRPDDTATCDVLATLASVWIEWLIEAAGNGDPAARAHLRDLGFHHFGREADA
jgi:hypothetical protein